VYLTYYTLYTTPAESCYTLHLQTPTQLTQLNPSHEYHWCFCDSGADCCVIMASIFLLWRTSCRWRYKHYWLMTLVEGLHLHCKCWECKRPFVTDWWGC